MQNRLVYSRKFHSRLSYLDEEPIVEHWCSRQNEKNMFLKTAREIAPSETTSGSETVDFDQVDSIEFLQHNLSLLHADFHPETKHRMNSHLVEHS